MTSTAEKNKKSSLSIEDLIRGFELMCTAKTLAEKYESNKEVTSKYVHATSRGHEAIQIALGMQLKSFDWVSPYYRDDSILLGIGLIISANFFLQYPDIFLEPKATLFIVLSAICHISIFNIATYFRTYKEEPLIPHSILSAFLHLIIYSQSKSFSLETLFLFIFVINFIVLVLTLKTLKLFKKNKMRFS